MDEGGYHGLEQVKRPRHLLTNRKGPPPLGEVPHNTGRSGAISCVQRISEHRLTEADHWHGDLAAG